MNKCWKALETDFPQKEHGQALKQNNFLIEGNIRGWTWVTFSLKYLVLGMPLANYKVPNQTILYF